MIPYSRQTIDQSDVRTVLWVLNSEYLTQGPKILKFEKALSRACGARYAVAVSSGTAALHLAYLAAGLEKGNEVITTPNTFAATANMLLAVGAKPIFCDIRQDTYNVDEKQIERLINKRTKAIVPVHFAGQPCDMDAILRIARKHKLIVIEDACHALGARYKNRKIGSLGSDMSVFSFHAVKAITTGEGGAILTDNKIFYQKLLLQRTHGISKNHQGKNIMTTLGYNYRLTDIQAALGISQLQKLDKFIKMRRQISTWYRSELKDLQAVILPKEVKGNNSGWHLYVILLKNSSLRDSLWSYLRGKGIGANFHYPAVYGHPYYRKIGYQKTKLPVMEDYQRSCLTLPCYPALSRRQVGFIARTIKQFFIKHGKAH
ncbi:MAG: UDP-4-amino-4,6-dideoxy-N-acetyl-beta-L-altrosamine transaminase [Candidatus Doudnabacteria bacterium]|nr:UDP-4-amino-4,6-dideoxy-N-acetyl-beta-L-altrosamine transaminase [Candidatus Doudnabacteria bacterium]